MPLTKITQTGLNYLTRENVDSDGVGFVHFIHHYEKQLGSAGASGNTVFTLTKPYVVGSHTLMVFVNGVKAELVVTPTLIMEYVETDWLTVTFGASLDNADVVEFLVVGSYENPPDTSQITLDRLPVGTIFPVVNSNFAPTGTIVLEGAYISKTTYANLYSGFPLSIGTYYGDGGATFRVPDYRGQFLRGRANGSAFDPDRNSRTPFGGPAGDNVGSAQWHQIYSHLHSISGLTNVLTTPNDGHGGAGDHMTPITVPNTNYTGGNETRPVNVYVIWVIKY